MKMETGGDRWRQVETGGDRWRQVETGGDRWRQVETGGDRWIGHSLTMELARLMSAMMDLGLAVRLRLFKTTRRSQIVCRCC